jgi:hypothetical protein
MDLLPLLGAQSMVLTEGAEWRAQVGGPASARGRQMGFRPCRQLDGARLGSQAPCPPHARRPPGTPRTPHPLPQRDAFNPGFASAFLKGAVPQFVECTRHLIARLEAAADEAAAADAAAATGAPPPPAAPGDIAVEGLAAPPGKPGVVLMHHMVILLVGWAGGRARGPG